MRRHFGTIAGSCLLYQACQKAGEYISFEGFTNVFPRMVVLQGCVTNGLCSWFNNGGGGIRRLLNRSSFSHGVFESSLIDVDVCSKAASRRSRGVRKE